MLIKYKVSNSSVLSSYSKGSYFKIKPNNKKVYEYIQKHLKCNVKNIYNLLDYNSESIGLVCCKIINESSLGGIQVVFIPLGEDGFYDVSNVSILYNALFKYKEDLDAWYYEDKNVPTSLKEFLEAAEVLSNDNVCYSIVKSIKGKSAAPKIIMRISNKIKEYYTSLGITTAYNNITASDI